jgi:hypothetical protein
MSHRIIPHITEAIEVLRICQIGNNAVRLNEAVNIRRNRVSKTSIVKVRGSTFGKANNTGDVVASTTLRAACRLGAGFGIVFLHETLYQYSTRDGWPFKAIYAYIKINTEIIEFTTR